ncbi:SDR family NAD(P)-dependent oxidoreductase [Rhizobium leguminosarum]|nr:SDR family NAD(P)-dependent oxidoreductase [Rhizobium leguminosarum]
MTRLKDSVAVVTGGGRGIGREIALRQAREGAKVAVLARTATEIEETASLIEDEGGQAIAVTTDVTQYSAVENAFARIASEFGPVDTLVNNHGSFQAFGPIWECDPVAWWRDVEINLQGTFHTSRTAARAPNRSTSGSTNRRVSAMQKVKSVNPSPPMKGSTENTSRI